MSSFSSLWIQIAGTERDPSNYTDCDEFGRRSVASKKKIESEAMPFNTEDEMNLHGEWKKSIFHKVFAEDLSWAPHRNHPEMSAGSLTPEQAGDEYSHQPHGTKHAHAAVTTHC